MSYDGSGEEEQPKTEIIFEARGDSSSEEPPMSEWSSLIMKIAEENLKKKQFEQGLYDPGSGEICAAYVSQSDSAVLRHPYYNYPSIPDPGVISALLEPPPKKVYPSDGQEYYLAICKTTNQCPVRIFHRNLLNTHINLSYYGVNPNGVRAMAMALEKNTFVTHFDLTDNWLNDDACFHLGQMLGNNSTLTSLNLHGCRIGFSGIRRICEGLTTNRALRVLNVSHCQIGDEGLEQLAHVIMLLSDIYELDLSNNGISGKGCLHLAEALEAQNKLTSVNLSHNNLYSFPSGLCSVLELLGNNPEFEYLNLSWNSLSGQKIATSIRNVFQSRLLRHIDLHNNKFCDTPIITKLIAWFAKPKQMKCFDLSYNPLTLNDAQLVIQKFQQSKIQALNLEGVNVNKQFVDVLKTIQATRKDVVVSHGYVQGGFKSTGPDARELVLNRVEYIGKKNKKRQVDIPVVILQFVKEKVMFIEPKDLNYKLKRLGAVLDEDLMIAVQELWPGEPTKKGAKTIAFKPLAEYIKRKWPDRKAPPTPPPEPEPEPVAKKGQKKK
ncbi:leucine-rich repeat-containing protein 74A-like [Cydia pomonella]|uniref:leucine-rich repeat-containing protein 74A-like n=1 Tax=Cydia pomonella TaxID=82600 RepID=UPI002ADDED91|nr:leucine-rich repeat-containing protein 74A-like [Cydia pomonella]